MSDDIRPRRGLAVWILPALALAAGLYVASFGPAVWVMMQLLSWDIAWIETAAGCAMLPYTPLILLGNQVEPLGEFLNWYVQVFDPDVMVAVPPSGP